MNAITQTLEMLYKVTHLSTFVSSGDCGAFENSDYGIQEYGKLGVAFPASSPYAIGVGGTILNVDAQGNRTSEVVWGDPNANHTSCRNRWGGGGGLSGFFSQPPWVTGAGVQNQFSNGHRQLPDVSAMAWNLPVYFEGEWSMSGGTSAAAPLWAVGMALVNQQLLRMTHKNPFGPSIPTVLANKAANGHPYFDVAQGDNLYYKATPGWDYGSGFGAPNFVDVYNTFLHVLK
ncbi:MAG: hypothetical protein J2P36_32745 [Ktedonobacteraceae bacterium]|nr:hypothetical protein [Ktedonobacteraceae bacterium]